MEEKTETEEEETEKILEEMKRNALKMQTKIKNDKIFSNLLRHRFFIRLTKLWCYFGNTGKVTPMLLSAEFQISRQYAHDILQTLCNLEIMERHDIHKDTEYCFTKNDKGEYYILDLIREGIKYHKKCCINSANFKIRINKKLVEFAERGEINKNED